MTRSSLFFRTRGRYLFIPFFVAHSFAPSAIPGTRLRILRTSESGSCYTVVSSTLAAWL